MNMSTKLKFMGLFSKCPNCGNERLGNGEGEMYIDETSFGRTCKCGYEIKFQIFEKFPNNLDVKKTN